MHAFNYNYQLIDVKLQVSEMGLNFLRSVFIKGHQIIILIGRILMNEKIIWCILSWTVYLIDNTCLLVLGVGDKNRHLQD